MSACLKLSSLLFENNAMMQIKHRHGKATLATVGTCHFINKSDCKSISCHKKFNLVSLI